MLPARAQASPAAHRYPIDNFPSIPKNSFIINLHFSPSHALAKPPSNIQLARRCLLVMRLQKIPTKF
jgi:hypothetical protein